MFFDELLVRQKASPKSQLSATLADKLKKAGWFWRGRRERRERRFSWGGERVGVMLPEFEDFAGEHSLTGSARRSEGGGGFNGYRLIPPTP